MLNLDSVTVTDKNMMKKIIQQHIGLSDYEGRQCLCENWAFANFVDSMLNYEKYKRNFKLQVDAFILVYII